MGHELPNQHISGPVTRRPRGPDTSSPCNAVQSCRMLGRCCPWWVIPGSDYLPLLEGVTTYALCILAGGVGSVTLYLHAGTQYCNSCVQLLVEKGADVNRPFGAESLPAIPFKHLVTQCPTALHLACDRGDSDLVKVRTKPTSALCMQDVTALSACAFTQHLVDVCECW